MGDAGATHESSDVAGSATTLGGEGNSLVLAADYRVTDLEVMWSLIEDRVPQLASVGAHHVVVYNSIWETGRVLVTIGIHPRQPVRELLRSPAIFELFDAAGGDDIPAVFVGEVVEKIDITEPGSRDVPPGVIVGALAPVGDVSRLMAEVHSGLERFRLAGCRKLWVYRALDDGHEVMILQEIDDEATARRWIDHPDVSAEWMSAAGFGAYPTVFVGELTHVMSVDKTR